MTLNMELSLSREILVGSMPWEGHIVVTNVLLLHLGEPRYQAELFGSLHMETCILDLESN